MNVSLQRTKSKEPEERSSPFAKCAKILTPEQEHLDFVHKAEAHCLLMRAVAELWTVRIKGSIDSNTPGEWYAAFPPSCHRLTHPFPIFFGPFQVPQHQRGGLSAQRRNIRPPRGCASHRTRHATSAPLSAMALTIAFRPAMPRRATSRERQMARCGSG